MDAAESLRRLAGPLKFAAQDDFARLHVVRDLERFVQRWAETAREDRGLPPPFIERITRLFSRFDTLPEKKKKERIRQALRLLKTPNAPLADGPVWALDPDELPEETSLQTMLKILSIPVSQLRGVGPSRFETLQKMGCGTLGDLLARFPFRYEDRRKKTPIRDLSPGQNAYLVGKLVTLTPKGFGKRAYLEAQVTDGTGTLTLKWFKGVPYFKKQLKVGTTYHIYGEVKRFGLLLEIHHPDLEAASPSKRPETFGTYVPVYPEVGPIGQKPFRKLVREAMKKAAPHLTDPLPAPIRERYHFPSLKEGLNILHALDPDLCLPADIEMARRRFLYETYFFFELFLALKKRGREDARGVTCPATRQELEAILRRLPFSLTKAQLRSVHEIFRDITSVRPMNRLLQGDVGSGKTVVSAVAAALFLNHGFQVALMAPTEILAQQHFHTFQSLKIFEDIPAALLTGSQRPSEKSALHKAIEAGQVRLVIGTHALFQKEVHFPRLGLVIIDEQHRFGVRQRLELVSKGPPPDTLMMTATPIPRTLAMTLYGDMDLSLIDELPPSRKPVQTKCVPGRTREMLYRNLRKEVEKGHQIYIIYPLIEESEKLDLKDATSNARWLQERIFPEYRVGLMHGRLSPEEKETLMSQFKSGEIQILVSTTVVEVGVDVPNASIMVIEHAERFGLSQLHQLRGRVGRGQALSTCYLVVHGHQSDEAKKRLSIMEETSNGFKIAEADLAIRGPGDLIGVRQSGSPLFPTRFLGWDSRLLKQARDDAFSLLRNTPKEHLQGLLAFFDKKTQRWNTLSRV